MRWKHHPPLPLSIGAMRVKTSFLLLPRTIGDETRWLERASREQVYRIPFDGWDNWPEWVDVRWVD